MEDVLADARRALAAGQNSAAANLLKQVVRTQPTSGEAWYLLGQALPEPAQKAECAQRATALGYVPNAESAAYTGATQSLNLSAERPSFAGMPSGAPEPDVADNRYASDFASDQQSSTSPTDNRYASDFASDQQPPAPPAWNAGAPFGSTTGGGPMIPPTVPQNAGYAYVMPGTAGTFSTQTEYAGFGRRFVAFIIDAVLTSITSSVLGGIVGGVLGALLAQQMATNPRGMTSFLSVIGSLIGFLVQWLYFAFFESSRQQATPGKLVMGLKVTDLQGNRISFGRATGRNFGKIVSALILFIGYIMAAFTERKQALHDLMAGTLVIHKR